MKVLNIANKEGVREQLAYLAIFLFPLAGSTVKSWSSTFFTLIVLLALAMRPWKGVVLHNWEKWLLALFVAMFAVMMLSNVVNGWEHRQTREFGVQVRYLAFVPVYFLIRRFDDSLLWIIKGTIFAAIMLLLQAAYEIALNSGWRVAGIYGPGLYATQALLFASVLFFALRDKRLLAWPRGVIVVALVAALLGLLLSGSRSTYLTLAVILVIGPLVFMPLRKTLLIYAVATTTLVVSYFSVGVFHDRVLSGIEEVRVYVALSDPVHEPNHGSVGARLEMWRTAWLIFQDNPVIGVGRGNFSIAATKYVDAGLAHPQSADHPHPHNGYFEFLVSNGSVGLFLLLVLLIYPYRVCLAAPSECTSIASLGKVFVLIFAVNSINEAATFIYGNFLATYLVYFGAIFSALGRCQTGSMDSNPVVTSIGLQREVEGREGRNADI